MPLRIKLPKRERLIVNGTVIENIGEATTLVIHNRADIVRRKEVMVEEEAVTPARVIYYAVQCAYVFTDKREPYLTKALQTLSQYTKAAPTAAALCQEIEDLLQEAHFYLAMRKTRELITYEDQLVAHAQSQSTD